MEDLTTGSDLVRVLIAGITALAGTVTVLYWQGRSHYEFILKKLDDCERDRLKLWDEIAAIKRDI